MPILSFTQADIMRTKTLDPGWYQSQITKVEGPKQSAAGDSVNITVTFLIENMNGKEVLNTYNSKLWSMMIPLISAIEGKKIDEAFQYNTDDLLNKKVDVKLNVESYEGRLLNKIEAYAAYETSKTAPVF